ncbi:DUF4436 family protein [Amycolatopsis sp. cg9]|uniref:DUF4436 family protein n=1 Tax=Amycolatopsis sp. cg9 TaxID=3238801 RepID=UPI0035247AC2
MIGLLSLASIGIAIWAAVPTDADTTLGTGDAPPAGSPNRYDGLVEITINQVDLRAGTMRANGRIELDVRRWNDSLTEIGQENVDVEFAAAEDEYGEGRVSSATRFHLDRNSVSAGIPSFVLPLTGYPASYPFDEYISTFRLHARVANRKELALAVSEVKFNSSVNDWVFDKTLRSDHLTATFDGNPTAVPNLDRDVRITFGRNQENLAYVLSIFLLPIVLIASYVLSRYRLGRTAKDARTSPLELAAALLAIVTLRQVLVPADVAGFTMLDKLFGIQAAIIIAVAAISHVTPESQESEGG